MDMPEYRPGASLSMEVEFWKSAIDQGEGGTLGGPTGFTLGGATGATLGSTSRAADFRARYRDVRRYLAYAGRAATNEAIDGTVHYRERLPTDSDVGHIVVAVRPSRDLQAEDTKAIWVLLDGGDDRTRYVRDLARIDFDATVLGTVDEYPNRSAIEDDLSS
jgi:hypothetical protein